MTGTYLLTVVEVSKEDRVLCQADGCGHSVFKRIHVVQDGDSGLKVLGSECFKRLYAHVDDTPRYGGAEGRKLTNTERQLLVQNTQRFIEQLEAERLAQYQRELQQRALQQQEAAQRESRDRERVAALRSTFRRRLPFQQWLEQLTPQQRQAFDIVRQQARDAMRVQFGADPDLPGFVGMVNLEARTKFEANALGSAAPTPAILAPTKPPSTTEAPPNAQMRLLD